MLPPEELDPCQALNHDVVIPPKNHVLQLGWVVAANDSRLFVAWDDSSIVEALATHVALQRVYLVKDQQLIRWNEPQGIVGEQVYRLFKIPLEIQEQVDQMPTSIHQEEKLQEACHQLEQRKTRLKETLKQKKHQVLSFLSN
jgi:hypothetical protein